MATHNIFLLLSHRELRAPSERKKGVHLPQIICNEANACSLISKMAARPTSGSLKRARLSLEEPCHLVPAASIEQLYCSERIDFEPAITKQRRVALQQQVASQQQVPLLFKTIRDCTREGSPSLTSPTTPQQRLEPLRPVDVVGLHRVRTGQPAAPNDDLVSWADMTRRTARVASTWFRACRSCSQATCFVRDGLSVCGACYGRTKAAEGD